MLSAIILQRICEQAFLERPADKGRKILCGFKMLFFPENALKTV